MYLDAFSRLVAATCSAAFALILWNIASRSPEQILRDISAGFSDAREFGMGCIRVAAGAFFACAAVILVATTLRYGTSHVFSIFAIATFVAALAVDGLIGDAVRRTIGIER